MNMQAKEAKQLSSVPLSNDTVARRIQDMAAYVKEELNRRLRSCQFALEIDDSSDVPDLAVVLVFVNIMQESENNSQNLSQKSILYQRKKPSSLASEEYEALLEVTSESSLQPRFKDLPVVDFWQSLRREYPVLSKKAITILLPIICGHHRSRLRRLPAGLKLRSGAGSIPAWADYLVEFFARFFPTVSIEQRVFIFDNLVKYESWRTVVTNFRQSSPDSPEPSKVMINNLVKKCRTTDSVLGKKRTCVNHVLTEETLDEICHRLEKKYYDIFPPCSLAGRGVKVFSDKRNNDAETDQKEKKKLLGSLIEKKVPTEGWTGSNGEREKSSRQKRISDDRH
ncbi:hypothetical protein ANN_02886 [Periplaneta americana]|uniref:Uncharacterized protein n=1 Tax=Periplaneta americana TaxID=6978 RepID=A0ABQ8TXI1_PERAM|nr:hypothetical protein ANN_02886 [Periplaneta americana]